MRRWAGGTDARKETVTEKGRTMTTDVLNHVPPTREWQELDATRASQGGRPLPTAAHVMTRAPRTIDSQASLFSAWGQLHGEHNRHLVVIDAGVRPIGVLDDRDIALEWPPGPLAAHHLPVYKLLRFRTRPRVRAEDDVAEVAATMLGAREDALPVVDEDGRLLGLITVWHCLEILTGARACDRQGYVALESAPLGSREPG
jgi:CBS domain-containing protein